jgi:hypothetical protein
MAGLSDSVIIVIAILVAGFVVICGAVVTKFMWQGNGDTEISFNQRSNEQENYMREVRTRNRAFNHFEARFADRFHGYGPKTATSTISASNVQSSY